MTLTEPSSANVLHGKLDSPEGEVPRHVESDISKIRELLNQRRYSDALAAANAMLVDAPDHRDGLFLAAVAQRYLGQTSSALRTLAQLELHHPRFSLLFQERGHCYVGMKAAPQAVEAFLQAVNINVALQASWRMLEGLYCLTGQSENAATAARHAAILEKLPSDVVAATSLFSDGDMDQAEEIIRQFLLRNGNNIEAMRLLARIGIARGVFDDAEVLLAAVLELAPDYGVARREYAGVLVERHKFWEARRELTSLLKEEPDNRYCKTLFAASCVGLGEHQRAVALYRDLLRGTPDDAAVHLSIAHALKTLGRRQEAIASYRAALSDRPDFGDAYWSLANLKTYKFTDDEVASMRAAEAASSTAPVDRYQLCFALGKALEDQRDYAEAFRYYEAGNALKRSESKYRAEIIESNTRQQMETCTKEFFASRRSFGVDCPDPIFIVGLPRSGSTLLEQILASHSMVEGTQELDDVQRIVVGLQGREPDLDNPLYPRVLAGMRPNDFRFLGEKYLADTRSYRAGKSIFIDKMPNNFRHIGLIHLMLPQAKIIDARRAPLACCFSNFKQLFASGQEFTYSVEDIARYYRTYLDLMRHWDEVLPGRILRVYHEDVVEDLEGSVRRILNYCGLEFEGRCVEFYRTERSVRTASSEQVRQPIYRDGLDQWKHFEPWLDPLKAALGDAVDRFRH